MCEYDIGGGVDPPPPSALVSQKADNLYIPLTVFKLEI